jgi:mannose-6-phosphate isomerase-like protein (cupin superfamily)
MPKFKQISKPDMLKRVARFAEVKSSARAFCDTLIPGHERDIFNVIGHGVMDDPSMNPVITDVQDFHVNFVKAKPGCGAASHTHPTVEVFIPMSGRWSVYWGDQDEEQVVLEQWDVISVPPGVLRGFRNVGNDEAVLLSILGGTDPGKVVWSPRVLDKAKATGLVEVTERGEMVRIQ